MKQIKPFLALLFISLLSLFAGKAADMCTPSMTYDMNVSMADPIEVGPTETVTSAAPDYYYIRANPEDINGTLSLYFTGTNISDDVYMAYADSNCTNTINYCTLPENNRTRSLELDLANIINNDINVKVYTCENGNKNYGKLKVVYTAYGSGLPDINTTIVFGKVDFIDHFTTAANYLNDQYIKTKIANFPTLVNVSTQGYQMDSVWINDTVSPAVPQIYANAGTTAIPLTAFYYLANDVDNGCTVDIENDQLFTGLNDANGKPIAVVSSILPGTYSGTSNRFLMPAKAAKKKRLLSQYIDFYRVYMETGEGCLLNAQTGQNAVPGMPACVASSDQYESAFGPTTANKCLNNNGNPCDPNNHGYGDGRYDHMYGCYQCTLEGSAEYSCSRDNFAIRPDKFDINSTKYDWPNLLRSAQDYNTTIHAYKYGTTTDTMDYNVTDANSTYQMTITKYLKTNAISTSMLGTASFASSGFDMADGLSVKSGIVGNEVAGLAFDDVGKINIRVEDRTWSAVDIDDAVDTTPIDCSTHGAYICGDTNVTFIPEHFDFNTLSLTNNNGNPGSFTYLANEVDQMAGRIPTQMRALNKKGNVTSNFALYPLWENPITVVPVVVKSTYLYPDANETNITTLAVGFGTGTDANGTKTIAWNETNTSQYLRFNFRRDVNLPQTPFDVNGSDLNISMTSHYVDGIKTADINGSRLGTISPATGNVKFTYGRIIPRDIRVFGANTTFTANGWYEVYKASTINGTLMPVSRNDANWNINLLHSDTLGNYDGDGNVTVVNTTSVNVGGAVGNDGMEDYVFTGGMALGGYKAHINTDPWLWYGMNALGYLDPVNATSLDCLTHPCFNINVVPAVGATGSAKSTNTNTKSSKKSDTSGWRSTSDYAPAVR